MNQLTSLWTETEIEQFVPATALAIETSFSLEGASLQTLVRAATAPESLRRKGDRVTYKADSKVVRAEPREIALFTMGAVLFTGLSFMAAVLVIA